MNVIEIIEKAKKSHEVWAKFLEKSPDAESYDKYEHIGNAKHHREWIKHYEFVISKFGELQTRNDKQSGEIARLYKMFGIEAEENAKLKGEKETLQAELVDCKRAISNMEYLFNRPVAKGKRK